MDFNFDRLQRTFEWLTSLGLWTRIFSWGKIKSQLISANGELQKLLSGAEGLKATNTKLENGLALEKNTSINLQQSVSRLEIENASLKGSNESLVREKEERTKELSRLEEANKIYLKR